MAIASDFAIDYINKRIYHDSGTTVYTVNAFYTWIQDTFDELTALDDTVPMSAQTPTDYTLDNGWFMDDTSFHFLKGGAIKTNGYNNNIRLISFGGTYTDAVAGDLGKIVTGGTTGDTGKLLAYNNTTKKWWVRVDDPTLVTGDLFDAAETVEVTTDSGTGTGTSSGASITGEDLWPNLYTLGTIDTTDTNQQIYLVQNGSRLASGSEWWPDADHATDRHIDVLIKVKELGAAIDSGSITIFLRHNPNTASRADLYDHFQITISTTGTGGRNAIPLATSLDLNNESPSDTSGSYSDIKIAFVNGAMLYSAVTGSFADFETVTGNVSSATGVFLRQTTTTGYGLMMLGNVVGTFTDGEIILGGTSGITAGATGSYTETYVMTKAFEQSAPFKYSVIVNCTSRTMAQVYEYFKYVTRIDSTFMMYPSTATGTSGLYHSVSIDGQQYIRAHEDNQTTPTNTFSPVKASPFGTFAGGKLFGAQGVWVENMATSDNQAFQLIDSDSNTRTPPNKQNITVSNLLSGDRVIVVRTNTTSSSTTIYKDLFPSSGTNTSGTSTFITSATIPSETPSSGILRIIDASDTGVSREIRYTYSSWAGSTFSGLSPTLVVNYVSGVDTAYVPFIDKATTTTTETASVIYNSDTTLMVRVRRYQSGGTSILPFESPGTFGSAGFSISTIRTTDSIVN